MNLSQMLGPKDACKNGPLHQATNVLHTRQIEGPLFLDEVPRLQGSLLAMSDLLQVGGGRQRKDGFPRRGQRRIAGQLLPDEMKLQQFQRILAGFPHCVELRLNDRGLAVY